ncbi:SPOR domain-containing protein [Roseibaca sp. Y0-43]|uniref:SPOR domain-containing protein n=1 Tax=Roseibaca sp. Y0-43 TaxID=2816854 RepID=UPI001D0C4E8B|nr:SPOR domain-containing protein [Roseibaca sp. Y0-43]MCC1482044.1 SPOR domain-containing protein [Roseibaca sp. Y0-43]
MGDGRYFTAHGAYPQGGYRPEEGVREPAHAAGYHDGAAWAAPQWPAQAPTHPDLTGGYAHQPSAPQAHGGWPQPTAGPRPGPRAEPRLSAAPQAAPTQPQPQPHSAYASAAQAPGYVAQPYGYAADEAATQVYGSAQHYTQSCAYDAQMPPQRPSLPPLSMGGMARGFGAVMSLVLMVGGGVWTWQMMQRDVSGVPVVRALEGPLRVAPDDPGGVQAAHQGLSVNELAADGESGLPNEIVLAPQPLDLDSDLSRPAQTQMPVAQPETLIEVGLPVPAGDTALADAAPLGFVTPNRSAVTRSPRPVGRSSQVAGAPQQPGSGAAVPSDSAADAALAAAVANSVAADLSRGSGIDVDPASIGPGTRLVQLGAYDSAAEARAAWDTLAQRFSPLLDDRGRVIEAAHSGGSVFYRLRAHGFTDERDARRFCAALIDQRLDCIPVLIR